jgi:hypothetical protein
MANVFISYVRSDAVEARQLVNALQACNLFGWDAADIAPGEDFSSAVQSALERSSALIVLLSPRTLDSEWVQFEIGAAKALDKKIIPIIISGDYFEEQYPEILPNRNWIDARNRAHEDVVRDVKLAVEAAH